MYSVYSFTSDYFQQLADEVLADGKMVEVIMLPEIAAVPAAEAAAE